MVYRVCRKHLDFLAADLNPGCICQAVRWKFSYSFHWWWGGGDGDEQHLRRGCRLLIFLECREFRLVVELHLHNNSFQAGFRLNGTKLEIWPVSQEGSYSKSLKVINSQRLVGVCVCLCVFRFLQTYADWPLTFSGVVVEYSWNHSANIS